MRIKAILAFIVFAVALSACENQKKVSEVVYDNYSGKDGFSMWIFPPNLVDKFISNDETDQKELLRTIDDFRIMFFDNEVDGKSKKSVKDEIFQLLAKRDFEDFLTINKDGADIVIKAIIKDEVIKEMHVIIGGEDKLIMASMTGKINMENVSKTINGIDFDDFEDIGKFSGDFDFDDFKFIF